MDKYSTILLKITTNYLTIFHSFKKIITYRQFYCIYLLLLFYETAIYPSLHQYLFKG